MSFKNIISPKKPLAIQCWPDIDSHVDYVWQYPKDLDENGRAIYGGIKVTLLPTFFKIMFQDFYLHAYAKWV